MLQRFGFFIFCLVISCNIFLLVIAGGDSSSTHQDAAAAQREINVADVAVTTNRWPHHVKPHRHNAFSRRVAHRTP